MAPKRFQPPFIPVKPDLNTPHAPAQPAVEAEDVVLSTMQNIILEQSPYAVVQRLASGTVRRDRLQITDEEQQAAKEEEVLRKIQRQQAQGASIDEGSTTREPSRADAPKKTKPTPQPKSKVATLTIEPDDSGDSDDSEA